MGNGTTRRGFIKAGMAAGAGLAAGKAAAQSDPLITEVQEWNQTLGAGVDERPYGMPSPFEKDVKRRSVPWLTADPISSINFTPLHELDGIITPNGLCFERHH
ncbi:MAG: sulfite dehydrogenase, partial [Amylibacter sp.]